jgi:gamma-glutamylcyclotransferase
MPTSNTTPLVATEGVSASMPLQIPEHEHLYFAFGSNLWLYQMATRCPESRYLGYARLSGYRWQINQRGYANVVPSPEDHVDGLVYLLSTSDEARLDINEGVPWAYEKMMLNVELVTARPTLASRKTIEIVDIGLGILLSSHGQRGEVPDSAAKEPEIKREMVSALVYVSRRHVQDDRPTVEYVDRINNGVEDSLLLGIDLNYIDRYIRPFIPARLDEKLPPKSQN